MIRFPSLTGLRMTFVGALIGALVASMLGTPAAAAQAPAPYEDAVLIDVAVTGKPRAALNSPTMTLPVSITCPAEVGEAELRPSATQSLGFLYTTYYLAQGRVDRTIDCTGKPEKYALEVTSTDDVWLGLLSIYLHLSVSAFDGTDVVAFGSYSDKPYLRLA